MRKVVAYHLVSLDGVAEDPDAFIRTWDEVMDAHLGQVIAPQDDVILGRRSYDEWARYWPTSDIEPFATFINRVSKHVCTSRPLEPAWSNASRIDGSLVDCVNELTSRPGRDIGVHASISITQALLSADLVDELRLVIAPAIAGSGRRLLDGVPPAHLELTECVTSPSGHLLADYRIVR